MDAFHTAYSRKIRYGKELMPSGFAQPVYQTLPTLLICLHL